LFRVYDEDEFNLLKRALEKFKDKFESKNDAIKYFALIGANILLGDNMMNNSINFSEIRRYMENINNKLELLKNRQRIYFVETNSEIQSNQAQNILQSELPKFFKKVGLKIDNIEWFAGLHENTTIDTFILCFLKKTLRIKNNKKCFSIGKLSGNAIAEFKANIELCATNYKARELIRKNILRGFG